jgi:hypothetical protein
MNLDTCPEPLRAQAMGCLFVTAARAYKRGALSDDDLEMLRAAVESPEAHVKETIDWVLHKVGAK